MEVLTAFGGSNGLLDGPVSALAAAPGGGAWAGVEASYRQRYEAVVSWQDMDGDGVDEILLEGGWAPAP